MGSTMINTLSRLSATVFLLCFAVQAPAADDLNIMEGVEYERLAAPLPAITDTGKVEVIELFWYGCPHCFRLEPHLNRWLATDFPDDAEFIRVPGTMNPGWLDHARAYYTAEHLGVLDQIHEPLLDAIHVDGRRINSQAQLGTFFEEFGVDRDEFDRTFRSFEVHTQINRAKYLAERSEATGVPALIVGGRYRTGVDMAGGYDRLFEVVSELVQMSQDSS